MTLLATATTETAPFDAISEGICERNSDVMFMTADLQPYVDLFAVPKRFPDQFLDVGMAEQNLLSVGAGISKAGYVPVATTFACYASRRAFDQMVICMGTGPRTCVVVGFTPGITSPARIHHQSTEDLAMTRAIPHATVIDPADSTEFAQAMNAAVERGGLVYMRGLRGRVAKLFDPETYRFEIGKTHELKDGGGVGIISTGSATEWVLEASRLLDEAGVEHGVLHVPTLKPARHEEIWAFCEGRKNVFTVENHNIVGGLGGLVAEVMADNGGGPRLKRLGVPDHWAPGGSLGYIREQLGLDSETLMKTFRDAA
ncbi:transketolase family protein [Vannielia litorea]|uniref:Transketolase subunit B n=1 Tax=Vannielia litorea TaxID=1217970 RepID=A0A1N6GU88_9RHOB|nr:transketolase C-terminal domain-containing protein [Vannielia litorea]SIO10905.1 transketolase subunit B [Vannielia litorea]